MTSPSPDDKHTQEAAAPDARKRVSTTASLIGERIRAASAPPPAAPEGQATPTIADLLDNLRARPGASWVATIADIEQVLDQMKRGATEPRIVTRAKRAAPSAPDECSYCKGDGKEWHGAFTGTCPVCHGTGCAAPKPPAAAPEIEALILKAVEAACRWHCVTDVVKVLAEIPCTDEWKAFTAASAAMAKRVRDLEAQHETDEVATMLANKTAAAAITRTEQAEQKLAARDAELADMVARVQEVEHGLSTWRTAAGTATDYGTQISAELADKEKMLADDVEVAKTALLVLCATRRGDGPWNAAFLKDFDIAIEGCRAITSRASQPGNETEGTGS